MSEAIIKKNGTDYPLLTMPNHYPADRVYLDGDTTKSVQDKCTRKADLTNLDLTGTTNTTGSTISSGTYFYLNGVLVRAKTAIASGATFTLNTNYEVVTAGGLNEVCTISQATASIIDTSKIFGVNSCKRSGNVATVELRCNSYGISSFSVENIATIDAKYIPDSQIFFDVLCLDSNGYPNGTVLGTIATNGTVSIIIGSNAVTGFILMVTYVI